MKMLKGVFNMMRYLPNENTVFDPMTVFDDFDQDFFGGSTTMKTDIKETENDYQVKAELPGFKKDGIHLDYNNDTLRIYANHDLTQEHKDEQGRVLRQERSSSNISRSFYLPGADADKIAATYDGGLLKLTLPKQAPETEDSHHIDIN